MFKITGSTGYEVKVVAYNSSKTFKSVIVALTSTFPVTFTVDEGDFFRIQFGLGNSATTPESITDAVFWLEKFVSFEFNDLNTYKATALTGIEDLDNIKTAGVYLASTNSIASGLTHSPVNTSFRLIVQYITSSRRLFQFVMVNQSNIIYYRYLFDETFGAWKRLSTYEENLSATNITVTPSNYLTYFPNGSYNDAMDNAIYTINQNVPLTDAPDGNDVVGISHTTSGYQFGTLITLSANNVDKTTHSTYVAQILIGYRNDRVSPTISYRIGHPTSLGFTWTKWSKLEENGVLHATNLVVYAGNTQYTFNDLNDAPVNGIFQIDLNMDGSDAEHTLLHHPAPGVSCVAMTYAFSSTTTHGKVQVVYTIDGRQYWRYGYVNAPNDYRWTNWTLHNDNSKTYIINNGRLANGTDLDTITGNCVYLLGNQSASQYGNNPIPTTGGYMSVYSNDDIVMQHIVDFSGNTYTRISIDSGSTWNNWA